MTARVEKFTIKLKNGQEVRVTWTKNCWGSDTLDHLEFRGPMTSTAYLSDFLPHNPGIPLNLDRVIEYASGLAQEKWDANEEKYGKQLTF